jgi:DNA polymerase III epsilon subunit-like protein
MALHFYCIDTETTGLSKSYHEITELCIIRTINPVKLYHKIKCEYPERASLDALKITNKTFADLLQGADKRDVVSKANQLFAEDGQKPGGRCIVGHNVSFDRAFLFALWESVGEEFPAWLWLDTIALTNEFIKISDVSTLNITKTATGKISRKLHAACDLVGVQKSANQHDAKSDTISTYYLWKKLIEEKNINHLPHIKTFVHKLKPDEAVSNPNDDLDMADIY